MGLTWRKRVDKTEFNGTNFCLDKKITSTPNSDGLIKCLRQRQDSFSVNPNIYALKFCSVYKNL